jgi:ribosomal protein S21
MTTVFVKNNMPVEVAIRRLNKQLQKRGLVADVKKNLTFISALQRRNRKKLVAKRRAIRNSTKFEV